MRISRINFKEYGCAAHFLNSVTVGRRAWVESNLPKFTGVALSGWQGKIVVEGEICQNWPSRLKPVSNFNKRIYGCFWRSQSIGTSFAIFRSDAKTQIPDGMTTTQYNVLLAQMDWEFSQAIGALLMPRGIQSLVARDALDTLDILSQRPVHTAIMDLDGSQSSGLGLVRMIRNDYPNVPCIGLCGRAERRLMESALELEIVTMIVKPIDLSILLEQLNRLFVRRYSSRIFSDMQTNETES